MNADPPIENLNTKGLIYEGRSHETATRQSRAPSQGCQPRRLAAKSQARPGPDNFNLNGSLTRRADRFGLVESGAIMPIMDWLHMPIPKWRLCETVADRWSLESWSRPKRPIACFIALVRGSVLPASA